MEKYFEGSCLRVRFIGKLGIFILLLYFYIYNPLFWALNLFGSVKIVMLIAIVGLLFSKKSVSYLRMFTNEFLILLLLALYTSVVVFSGDGTASSMPYRQIIWFIECFSIPIFFTIYFGDLIRKIGWEIPVIIVSVIAALITLYLITHPATNLLVRSSLIQDSLDSLDKPEFFRGFTIAESSSYIYGIVQGIACSLCLLYIRKSAFFVLPIILLIISIVFNARIGIFVLAISLLFCIVNGNIKLKHILLLTSLVFIGSIFFITSSFYNNNEDSFKWIFAAFTSTKEIDVNDENSNYSFLFSMLFVPKELFGILFGEGRMAKNSSGGSDIGFVSHLFIGGILMLIIELMYFWKLFRRILAKSDKKIIVYIFFTALLIANFKGEAFFVPSGFSRLIMFHYVFFIISSKIKKEPNKLAHPK